MKLSKKCSHPECDKKLNENNESRFCTRHADYSTLKRFAAFKRLCKRRNLPVNISFPKYIETIKQGCFYCGDDLMIMTGAGLDRKNNTLGYSIKNTVPCCPTCNNVRGNNFTVEEFKLLIDFVRKMRNNIKQIWPKFLGFNNTKRRKRKYGI